MKNLWSDSDAAAMIELYAKDGVNEDVALRVHGRVQDRVGDLLGRVDRRRQARSEDSVAQVQ